MLTGSVKVIGVSVFRRGQQPQIHHGTATWVSKRYLGLSWYLCWRDLMFPSSRWCLNSDMWLKYVPRNVPLGPRGTCETRVTDHVTENGAGACVHSKNSFRWTHSSEQLELNRSVVPTGLQNTLR